MESLAVDKVSVPSTVLFHRHFRIGLSNPKRNYVGNLKISLRRCANVLILYNSINVHSHSFSTCLGFLCGDNWIQIFYVFLLLFFGRNSHFV